MITIIGLGTSWDDLTMGAYNAIKNSKVNIVKTNIAKSYDIITQLKVPHTTLDHIYLKSRNFDTLNKNLAKAVLDMAKSSDVTYLVDGAVSDDYSAKIIIKKYKNVKVINGVSKSSKMLEQLNLENTSCHSISAYDIDKNTKLSLPLCIFDIDNHLTASEIKLILMDRFGDEIPAYKFINGCFSKISLFELDHENNFDYTGGLVVPMASITEKSRFDLNDLCEILYRLRAENGCPWDRVQTKTSVLNNLIEEAYELKDAVLSNDELSIIEEVGDLLLQAVFQMIFGEEDNSFSRFDCVSSICNKLISRHTHVFAKDTAQNEMEALSVWTKNKQTEKGYQTPSDYILGVPKSFPALLRAEKVHNRAKKYNFDFENINQVFDKVFEEIEEVKKEIASGNKDKLTLECGDLLFACCNVVRFLGLDCEHSLNLSTDKFVLRFTKMDKAIRADGKNMKDLSLAELEVYYNAIKAN